MKKHQIRSLIWAFVVLSVLCSVCYGARRGDVSPEGLELKDFKVKQPARPVKGDRVTVVFTLKNVSGRLIRFDSNGVFVGCRANSISDMNNRDFGHTFRGLLLEPKKKITVKAAGRLDEIGEWRFWPAYQIDGRYGPFRWNEKVVVVR